MTPRQRLLTALGGGTPDRIPVTLYEFSHFDDRRPADDANYTALRDMQRQLGECIVHVGVDIGTSMQDQNVVTQGSERFDESQTSTATIATPEGPLTTVLRRDAGNITWWRVKPWLESPEDCRKWLSLQSQQVDPDPTPILQMQEKVGEQGLVWYGPGDALGLICGMFHFDAFAMTLMEDEGLILEMLGVMSERINRGLKKLCAKVRNVGIRFWGPEYAGAPLLNPRKYFEKLVTRFDAEPIRIIKESGNFAIIHCHGNMAELLDYLLDLAPTALEPLEVLPASTANVTMRQVKEKLGSKMCLMGGIQASELELLQPDALARRMREILNVATPGGGFVMLPTSAPFEYPLRPEVVENYRVYFQAVHEASKA